MKKILKVIGIFVVLGMGIFFSIHYYQRMIAKENKRKVIPEEIWNCLYHPKEMVLFSLEPINILTENNSLKKETMFQRHVILGSTIIKSQEVQNKIAVEINDAVNELECGGARCFEPRHGVRVTDGKVEYDFLICFECDHMYVYSAGNYIAGIDIGGRDKVFNEILMNAKVPLPIRGN